MRGGGGFSESANTLEMESGISLETAAVAEFRHAVLEGEWRFVCDKLNEIGMKSVDVTVSPHPLPPLFFLVLMRGWR